MLGLKNMSSISNFETSSDNSYHDLNCEWTYWAHLPHDTDWSLKSYKKISDVKSVEKMITLSNTIPDIMTVNCMLFIMRKNINPTWEDKHNKNGGCFSYKISNKLVPEIWKKVSYALVGETLSTDKTFLNNINGITISPKKNFCILKIWLSNCNHQDPTLISNIKGLENRGCLFKRHITKH